MSKKIIPLKDFPKAGKLIRDNERYEVYDLPFEHWRVSMTKLHPRQSTTGHSHQEALEIYFVIEGKGQVRVGNKTSAIKAGDIVLVPRGKFHKVFNLTNRELIFICVFEKYEGR